MNTPSSFDYYNPTKVVFGKNQFARLKDLINDAAAAKNILVVYGGGSIKSNGIYQEVMTNLKGFTVFEFSGVEPNPEFSTLMRAAALVREENIDFVLAVGGGSVIDGVKFITAAAKYSGDPWDVLLRKEGKVFTEAVPFGTVLTLPATGSEMNSGAVISRSELNEKRTMGGPFSFPKFSVLDLTVVRTLPKRQIANGITDAFMHTLEQYLTYPTWNLLQERIAEGILQTLIETAPKVIANPEDENAAGNLMWCATMALNGTLRAGVAYDWCTHMIGHELTALYGIDHARTLAIIAPQLFSEKLENKREKLTQYGQRVWGLEGDCAEEAIAKTRVFFESLGIETRISAYTSDHANVAEIIKSRFEERGWLAMGERQDITPDEVERIVNAAI
jgi:NADP-dependent alcohol dehydrogenase